MFPVKSSTSTAAASWASNSNVMGTRRATKDLDAIRREMDEMTRKSYELL